jgi:hypothetical protein
MSTKGGRSASLNRDKLTQNATDWQNFVHAFQELATTRIGENQILGPVSVQAEDVCCIPSSFFIGIWLQSYNNSPNRA